MTPPPIKVHQAPYNSNNKKVKFRKRKRRLINAGRGAKSRNPAGLDPEPERTRLTQNPRPKYISPGEQYIEKGPSRASRAIRSRGDTHALIRAKMRSACGTRVAAPFIQFRRCGWKRLANWGYARAWFFVCRWEEELRGRMGFAECCAAICSVLHG